MKILLCCYDKNVLQVLEKECLKNNCEIILCQYFSEIFLHSKSQIDMFFCDVLKAPSYNKFYLEFCKERELNIPYTVFIYPEPLDGVETLTYEQILSADFKLESFFNYSRLFFISKEEQSALNDMFKYYGLSNHNMGTKYLKDIFIVYYLNKYKHQVKFKDIYNFVGNLYGKSCNAIKKSTKRSIECALTRKGKGVLNLLKEYNMKKITTKPLIGYLMVYFNTFMEKYKNYHYVEVKSGFNEE